MRSDSQPDSLPPASLDPTEASLDRRATPGATSATGSLFDEDLEIPASRSGWWWMVASGLVLAVGMGGWLGYRTWQSRQVEPPMVSTATVARQTLEERVDASGLVTLGNQQTLRSPGEVTVEAVLVQERQRVERGAVLIQLRDRNLERQIDEQLIETELLALQLQRAQEILAERQRDGQRAEERLTESRSLLDRGFIAEDEYNRDRDALETAQSALREAQVTLQEVELNTRRNQAALTNLRAQLSDNAIVAPFDAVVLNINVQPGQGLTNDSQLLTLGDPSREMVEFTLMPLDAGKVSVNMPVRVSVIGPNPEPFPGRVISIAPQAVSGDGGSRDSQAAVSAVAQLDQPSGILIPGSAVSVEVVLVQRTDAIAIPTEALQRDDDTPYVWVLTEDNTLEKRTVTVGLNTLDALEITAGLRENETIIPNPPPEMPLTDGMTVVPSSSARPAPN